MPAAPGPAGLWLHPSRLCFLAVSVGTLLSLITTPSLKVGPTQIQGDFKSTPTLNASAKTLLLSLEVCLFYLQDHCCALLCWPLPCIKPKSPQLHACPLLPTSHPLPPLEAVTEHQAELPGSPSSFPFAVYNILHMVLHIFQNTLSVLITFSYPCCVRKSVLYEQKLCF